MEKEHQVRLECLKLAYRVDRFPAQVIEYAIEYEKYVLGQPQTEIPNSRKEASAPLPKDKKAGNPKL